MAKMSTTCVTLFLWLFLNCVFSQDICVSNTPISSYKYWDGQYNISGSYYVKRTPGSYLYLYYGTSGCPGNLVSCWCFSTSSPGSTTKYCSIVGNRTSTPDEVTKWYAINTDNTLNGSVYSGFTVEERTDTSSCSRPESVGKCYKLKGANSNYNGKYKIQHAGDKIWWDQYQYKNQYSDFFIYKYFLFMSTKNALCSEALLNTLGMDYCWCLSSNQADEYGTSCEYEAPVVDTATSPNTAQWYNSYGEIATHLSLIKCPNNSSSDSSDTAVGVIVTLIIVGSIVACIYCCVRQRRQNISRQQESNLSLHMNAPSPQTRVIISQPAVQVPQYPQYQPQQPISVPYYPGMPRNNNNNNNNFKKPQDPTSHVLMVTKTNDIELVKRILNSTVNLYFQDSFKFNGKIFIVFYTTNYAQKTLRPSWNENYGENGNESHPFRFEKVPNYLKNNNAFKNLIKKPRPLPDELRQLIKENREKNNSESANSEGETFDINNY